MITNYKRKILKMLHLVSLKEYDDLLRKYNMSIEINEYLIKEASKLIKPPKPKTKTKKSRHKTTKD